MGLDHTLSKIIYVQNWSYMQENEKTTVKAFKDGKPLNGVDFSNEAF